MEDKMVISMLLNFGDDSRTLCYASILQIRLSDRQTCDIEIEKIRSLAKKGYALAQALTAQCMKNTQEEYEWALLAAKQRDRLGLFILGDCLEKGKGCVKNTIRAIEMYVVLSRATP